MKVDFRDEPMNRKVSSGAATNADVQYCILSARIYYYFNLLFAGYYCYYNITVLKTTNYFVIARKTVTNAKYSF